MILVGLADIVFWPTAMDFKLKDVEKIGEKEIDIKLHHGTIRTSENEHMVEIAFRAYDPCLAYATHSLPGQISLEIVIRDQKGNELQGISHFTR